MALDERASRTDENHPVRTRSDRWNRMPLWAKKTAEWIVWTASRRSGGFWDLHYRAGGTSGPGSRGANAEFKASQVNRIVAERGIQSVVEFGCGDGYQLGLLSVPAYIGIDVSPQALRNCIARYGSDSSKSFLRYDPECWQDPLRVIHADMALSMEVILHLVEEPVFETYMEHLFSAGDRFVLICSTNQPSVGKDPRFTRHRRFTDWVRVHRPDWQMVDQVDNPDPLGAGFYLFARPSAD